MAYPAFRAAGNRGAGTTGAVTVPAPAGIATGDFELLVSTTIAGGSVSITNNGGSSWTAVTNTPVDVTGGEKLYAWYRIRQSGDGDPQVTPGSDHSCSGRFAYQVGTFDTSTPIEIATNSNETTSDTSFSWAPGTSTTVNECRVVVIVTSGVSSNTGQAGTNTANDVLTNEQLRAELQTNSGGGGGFWLADGERATAGGVGTWSQTMVSATPKAYLNFAIRPAVAQDSSETRNLRITGKNTESASRDLRITGDPAVEARVSWLEIELPEAADTEESSDTRDLRITGRDTSEASRSLRVVGAATSSDSRQLRVTGQDSASQTRSMRIVGKSTDSATRDLRITGRNASADSRSLRITGTATSSDTRSIRIVGAESSSASRDLRIFGAAEQTSASRDLRIVGTATDSAQVSIRIFGRSSGDDPANAIELNRTINYAHVEVIPLVVEPTVNLAAVDDGRNSIEVLPENG